MRQSKQERVGWDRWNWTSRVTWRRAILALLFAMPLAGCDGVKGDSSSGATQDAAIRERIEQLTDAERKDDRHVVDSFRDFGRKAVPPLIDALRKTDDEQIAHRIGRALAEVGDIATLPLIEALGDDSAALRRRAARALGDMRKSGKHVVPALIGALRDEDSSVRQAAAESLGSFSQLREQRDAALIVALKDAHDGVRIAAANSLGEGEAATRQTVTALIAALRDKTPQVRSTAATSLGFIGDARAVPALAKMLRDDNENLSSDAGFALRRIGGRTAIEALLSALDDEKRSTRWGAASGLYALDEEGLFAIPILAKALASEDDHVRSTVGETLERMGSPAVPALSESLSSDSKQRRYSAATILGNLRGIAAPAVPALTAALKHEDVDTRIASAAALGQIGLRAKSAVPTLRTLLKDEIEHVRREAARALGLIGSGGAETIPLLFAQLQSDDPLLRAQAAVALDKLGERSEKLVPALIEALGNAQLRSDAALALANLGPAAKAGVPQLITALNARDARFSGHAARALGRIGPDARTALAALTSAMEGGNFEAARALPRLGKVGRNAIPAMYVILEKSSNLGLRSAVAESLAEFGTEVVPSLIVMLKDADDRTASYVVSSLGHIGPDASEAIPQMIATLERGDQFVRSQIARTLPKMGPDAKKAIPALIKQLKQPEGFEAGERSAASSAATALGEIGRGDPRVLQALIEAFDQESPFVHKAAAEALAEFGPDAKQAVPVLTREITAGNPYQGGPQAAMVALGKLGSDAAAAVPVLVKKIREKRSLMRIDAARALIQIGDPASDALNALTSDKDIRTRCLAIGALGRIHDDAEKRIPELLPTSNDLEAVQAAALGLTLIGPDAVPTLISLLDKDDDFARSRYLHVLGSIGPDAKAAVPAITEIVARGVKLNEDDIRHIIGDMIRDVPVDATQAVRDLLESANSEQVNSATHNHKLLEGIEKGVIDKAKTVDAFRKLVPEAGAHARSYPKYRDVEYFFRLAAQRRSGIRLECLAAMAALGEIGPDAKDAIDTLRLLADEGDKHFSPQAQMALSKIIASPGK